jgi:hypothetical protein
MGLVGFERNLISLSPTDSFSLVHHGNLDGSLVHMISDTDESGLPLIDYGIDFCAGLCFNRVKMLFLALQLTFFLTSKVFLYEKIYTQSQKGKGF